MSVESQLQNWKKESVHFYLKKADNVFEICTLDSSLSNSVLLQPKKIA